MFKVFESFGSFSFFRFVTHYDIISISLMIFMLNYAFTHILFLLCILCSSVEMSNRQAFNNRNLFLTAKLLKQGYRYHKIRKAFSRFYHRHSELIVKYNIGLKTLLQEGISEPIFYGDLVYKLKRIVGKPNFSGQFKKIVKR